MKKIKLQRLTMENFKCHRFLALDFGGGLASIYGDNATGKTSVYDALTWLLFGRDSLGNGEKNMEIKPLNAAGEVADHHAMTEAYNMDCVAYMAGLPDKCFDLAVVDPPYGGSLNGFASEDGLTDIAVSRTGGTWAKKYGKKS